jgi:RNA-directed DNA polymerase
MSASKEFRSVFKLRELEDIYFSSIKYSSTTGIDKTNTKVFEKHLVDNLEIIIRKSLNGTYNFSQYREKLISKGAEKKPRVISIPTLRDKLTLKALYRILYSLYGQELPFLHKVVNEVHQAISQRQYDGVLKVDVKNFYPEIRHDLLISQLSKRIKKKEIIHLIASSISQQAVNKGSAKHKKYNSIGLPQGLPISNILADVYMKPIDKKFKRRKTLKYFRYVDDILILCDLSKVEQIYKELSKECGKICLTLHDDPPKLYKGGMDSEFIHLGYKFKGSITTVGENSHNNLRESIIKNLTYYKYSKKKNLNLLYWTLNLRITGCQFNKTKYGWMFYYSQINDHQLLSSLDHFVKKQLSAFGILPNQVPVKKFIRSFYEITRNLNSSKYIPNFDILIPADKRIILKDVFWIDVANLSDNQVNYQFRQKIFQNVRDLERDLSRNS